MTQIYLTTLNYTDASVIFSIDGDRYEYFQPNPDLLRRIDITARKSEAEALNFAKRNALRCQRLEDV